jgi:hypothetical protein
MKMKMEKKWTPFWLKMPGEKRKFLRMGREDRLKCICKHYLGIAFTLGVMSGESKKKKDSIHWESLFRSGRIAAELTRALKKGGVLPLG